MKTALRIGTAQSKAGEISYGTFEGVQMPTGSSDDLPVIIAQGKRDGPVLWVTAAIHGNEYTGVSVIHRLLTSTLVAELRGAVVAIPTLNPAGLRIGDRRAYYLRNQDPNRLFPSGGKKIPNLGGLPSDPEPISALENVYKNLFEQIIETGDYLVDLHNYSLNSLPFSFRDPIGYTDEQDKAVVRQLQTVMDTLLQAFGHTIINEYATADYLKRNLHRSVSGAVLNTARIPAFTVELGGYLSVDPQIVSACCAGLRNVMRFAGMLDSPMEAVKDIKILAPGYPIRRIQHPYAPQGGIMSYAVKSGDPVKRGDVIGRLTDIWGRPVGVNDGQIKTDYEGFVLGVSQGTAFYQGDSLLSLAIRDDNDLLVQF